MKPVAIGGVGDEMRGTMQLGVKHRTPGTALEMQAAQR